MRNCTDSGISYSCLKNSTITRKLLMKSRTGQVGDPVFARFIPWAFYILDAGFCDSTLCFTRGHEFICFRGIKKNANLG